MSSPYFIKKYQKKGEPMRAIQRVKKILKNINPLIRNYVIALIVSRSRKNCAAMAHSTGISDKFLYDFLGHASKVVPSIEETLKELVSKPLSEKDKRAFAIDPTHIIKPYAKHIEKLCYDRTGTTKRTEQCLVPIYAMVIDKFNTIPLTLKFWMQEKLTGKKRYKSKAKITIELIVEARKNGVQFGFIPLDGGFAVPEMFEFFSQSKEQFVMRIPRNRKIETDNGISAQLQHHPDLKLYRNQREKVVTAKYKGNEYFFIAHKRRTKDGGYETIYLVSNMDLAPKQYLAAYNMRWPLEKVIRTTKQKFGAMQCQALDVEKQQAHILAGFLAYAILETANNDKELLSVDELVREIRDYYTDDLIKLIEKPNTSKQPEMPDPIAKLLQKAPLAMTENRHLDVSLAR